MPGFRLSGETDRRLMALCASREMTLSQLVRFALAEYAEVPTVDTRGVQRTVRLDGDELAKLSTMAGRAKLSKSRALALLVEMALDDLGTVSTPRLTMAAKPVGKAPGPNAWKSWARLLLECAEHAERRTPGDRKAWICSVLDVLAERVPEDQGVRDLARDMLPELNRRNLLALSRCDLVPVFPFELVERSELQAGPVTWHFIEASTP